MESVRRVTQADIAARAGCHRATVSLVFKNHPSIPAETKERVLQISKEMGYSPDPMLSALAAYRSRLQPHGYQGTLAWLTRGNVWSNITLFKNYFLGASQRAKDSGYDIEVFNLQAPGMTAKRMASILRARNVPGVLVCPQEHLEADLVFAWECFSAVKFGYSLLKPDLHIVAATHYRAIVKTMRNLYRLGYRRIGYAVWPEIDEKADFNCLAGYVVEEFKRGKSVPVRPFAGELSPPNILRWVKKNRLDAIVTADFTFPSLLKGTGLNVPGDIGVACFALPSAEGFVSGISENSIRIGEIAVDTVVAMVNRGERGLPQVPYRILVEGQWFAGKSLRPQK